MIRFKTLRLSNIIYFLIILALVVTVVYLSWRLLSGNHIGKQGVDQQEQLQEEVHREVEEQVINPAYKSMLAGGFPAVAADGSSGSIFSILWNMVIRGDIRDPKTIMNYPMPYLEYSPELPDNELGEAVEVASNYTDRNGIDRSASPIDISRLDSEEGKVQEVSDEIRIQIDGIQVDDSPVELSGDGPKILIYHSHSRESFKQDPKAPYKEASSEPFRTDDHNYSIIKTGTTLAHELTRRGVAVLHDQTDHEKGNYNASYTKSLKTLKKRMTEHDSLQVFIDVHRNAYDDESKIKSDNEVIIINGERVAKLLLVVGTGEGIVGGFKEKPNWKENAKLAIKLTNKLNELYPGLAKPVLYRKGRFNQHVYTKAILVEAGSTHTTLAEVERATDYLAEAISQIIE
ncbi:MAG: stage II sporulation protein P, partial [Clostridiales bacterium]|nr:stage II sporulation protein P [Clostridiales bacterium]